MDFSSVQISLLVISKSLQPHGLQHARLPCPSHQGCQASLSWSLLKLMPIESVMTSNHHILHHLLLLLPSTFPSIRVFSNVSSLHQVAKVLELQLQHQSFQWIFRVDFLYNWLVWSPCSPGDSQEAFIQHHSSKVSILQHSAFFMVQLSHLYMTETVKT